MSDEQVKLVLTREQAAYLDDILSMWIEGYDDAKDQTIADQSIEDFDDLMVLTSSLVDQQVAAIEMRYKVREGMNNV